MKLNVVVLTSQPFGHDMARAVGAHPDVKSVHLVTAPLTTPTLRVRLRRSLRTHGLLGMLRRILSRAARSIATEPASTAYEVETIAQVHRFANFHHADCIDFLRASRFDVGIVDGTGILKESVFSQPRLGCLNLHCGKLPDYRGAPPAFWELMNGETQCGVTVHEVTAVLDAGKVLAEDLLPLDPAPAGDVMKYVKEYWMHTLRPRGVQLVLEVITMLASNGVVGREQGAANRPTNRSPSYAEQQKLRRLVAERRRDLSKGSLRD